MSSSPAQGSGKERPTRKKPAGFYVKGQQVVARFKGRSLYPGRIKDAQLFTKTYTVEYDDGDVEENVPLAFIFPRLAVGTRVEAAFEEGLKYYPGVVSAINDDWTYAVLYDDGDEEDYVQPEFVVPFIPTLEHSATTNGATATSPATAATSPGAGDPSTPQTAAASTQLQQNVAQLLFIQQQQVQNQIYLSQQLAHSIRIQEQLLAAATNKASAQAAAAATTTTGGTPSAVRGDGPLLAQEIFAEVPVMGPDGQDTSAVAIVRLRVTDGAAPPAIPLRGDLPGGVGAAPAANAAANGLGRPPNVRRRRNLQWNDVGGLAALDGRILGRQQRRRRRGIVDMANAMGLQRLLSLVVVVLVVLATIFQDTTRNYLDLLSHESSGYAKYETAQLWLQSAPSNEPMHLCYGMSVKNLNPYKVEIRAYHVTDLETPQQVTTLGPNEVLKLPPYERLTAYEVSRVIESGNARGAGSSSNPKNSNQQSTTLTKTVPMYSFAYDAELLGSSTILRLKSQEPSHSACHEYANGQFRPESGSDVLPAYATFGELRHDRANQ